MSFRNSALLTQSQNFKLWIFNEFCGWAIRFKYMLALEYGVTRCWDKVF